MLLGNIITAFLTKLHTQRLQITTFNHNNKILFTMLINNVMLAHYYEFIFDRTALIRKK